MDVASVQVAAAVGTGLGKRSLLGSPDTRLGGNFTRRFRGLLGEPQGPQPLGLFPNGATLGFVLFPGCMPFFLSLLRRAKAGFRLCNLR